MFIVQAKIPTPTESANETNLVAGADYVVYAVSGAAQDVFWLVPYPDTNYLDPVRSALFDLLVERPTAWSFDEDLKIAAPRELLVFPYFLEGIADGLTGPSSALADLRARCGDVSTAAGEAIIPAWIERVRSGRSATPTTAALRLALRQGWLPNPGSNGTELARELQTWVPPEVLDDSKGLTPDDRILARRYWASEFAQGATSPGNS